MTQIRPMSLTDCESVAELHRHAAPNQTNVQLGSRYLTAFFTYFVRAQGSTALVAIGEDGGVVGYCIGARQPYRGHMIVRLGLRAVPAILRRPRLWASAVRVVADAIRSMPLPRQQPSYSHQYSLVGIAVHPSWRRQHVAERLIRAFREAATRPDNPTRFRLSVRRDNLGARRLYERDGWTPAHVDGADVITYELVAE
jgi:ribosomal protein S18 acetylase RimI-like enzyme